MTLIPSYSPMDSEPGGESGRVTRFDVVRQARLWLDTPFKHQHRARGHGVDCAGLVIGVARELGLVAPDFDINGYPRSPDGKELLAECDRFMTRIPLWELKPGHVLVIRFDRHPQHLGIVGDYMVGGLSLIQALGEADGKGRVIEWNLAKPRKGWKPVAAYALPGVV